MAMEAELNEKLETLLNEKQLQVSWKLIEELFFGASGRR